MNGNIPIENSWNLEFPLTGVTVGTETLMQKANNIATLQEKIIYGMEIFSVAQQAKTQAGDTVVSALGITGLIVTLCDQKSNEFVNFHPCFDWVPSNNGGFIRFFPARKLDFTRSKIIVVDATNLVAGNAMAITFIFKSAKK